MKVWGWILIVFGVLSGFGAAIGGHSPAPLVWAVIGIYLLHRAKREKEKNEEKENWNKKEE